MDVIKALYSDTAGGIQAAKELFDIEASVLAARNKLQVLSGEELGDLGPAVDALDTAGGEIDKALERTLKGALLGDRDNGQ